MRADCEVRSEFVVNSQFSIRTRFSIRSRFEHRNQFAIRNPLLPSRTLLNSPSIDPLHYLRRLISLKSREKRPRIALDDDHRPVNLAYELFLHRTIEELEQRIEVAGDVEQAARFFVHAELRPGPDLENFLQCSDAAGQCDESVRQLGDQRLSIVHR